MAYESLQNTLNTTDGDIRKETYKEKEKIINIDEEIESLLLKDDMWQNENWQVEIPAIGLKAPISQGTTQEVMREYVGHFDNTSMWKGNIGLAAHNRRISNKLF